MLRYAITDRVRFPGDEATQQAALLKQASQLTANGVDFLQLREKDLEAGAIADLARRILAILRASQRTSESAAPAHTPKLLINSRADIAIAVAADGMHLTAARGSLTPAQVRKLYAAANLPDPIISVSCHTLDEVACAAAKTPRAEPDSAATLILFGPVFEKVVGTEAISAGAGLELLRAACALAAPTPVLALGGIAPQNTAACLGAGAAGIAAIRLFVPLVWRR
jgi:thiamine-phosphate pyrophosphorylase